jgi:membrane-associated phospholipid phosphatase
MGWDNPVDRAVMDFVVDHRTAWATAIAKAVMWAGTTTAFLALTAVAALVAVIVLRAWRTAAAAGLALVLSAAATAVLKSVFERPRPPADIAMALTHGFSFPSTQAAETAAVTVALLLTTPWGRWEPPRATAPCLVAVTLLVGICMVYLGAHWPTDVLAGWALGAVLGAVATRVVDIALLRSPRPRRGARP